MKPRSSEHLLRELFDRLGLPDIEPDAEGAYALAFDDDLLVTCRCDSRTVRFESRVGVLPVGAVDRERVLESLLLTSAATLHVQESVLYLDPPGGSLMLYRQVTAERLEGITIRESLEEFLSSLEHWRAAADRAGGDRVREPDPRFSLAAPVRSLAGELTR